MIHPIPSGTRDVLPDEMRELRAITETLRSVFERHGYGEVYTPAIEYESVMAQAPGSNVSPAYRVFDDHGDILALRADMTVPIARLVATRYPTADPARAVIADFQNQWGGVLALALFGGFPLLGGLFFLFTAIGGARVQHAFLGSAVC